MNNPRYSLIQKAISAQADQKKVVLICGPHTFMATHVAFDPVQTDGLVHAILDNGWPIWLLPDAIDGVKIMNEAS